MQIKQYIEKQVKVRDPMRPGRFGSETRMYATGCDRITDQGVDYDADDNGYIEVPESVGNLLHKSRGGKGERWYTPQEVFEEISIGRMEEAVRRADVPVQRGPVRVAP